METNPDKVPNAYRKPDAPGRPIEAPPQIHLYTPTPVSMPATGPSTGHPKAVAAGFVVLSAVFLLIALCVVGITGYFRLSSPTAALRSSVMSTVPGPWDKTVALRVGSFTTGLVRAGSRLFDMPPEPRAALDAIHGAEVGVYKLQRPPARADLRGVFVSADRAMKSRGWERIVGVVEEDQFVAVYLPRGKVSLREIKCCVVVFEGRNLVVASASGNVEPLLKLAETHLDPGFRKAGILPVSISKRLSQAL